jgi:hypothetical protein
MKDSGLLRCARNNGEDMAARPHATHDAIVPVFCPTSQTSVRSKNFNAANAVLLCMGLFSTFLFSSP